MSYYKNQLDRINTKSKFNPSFKITSEDGDTKWMDLNKESAQDLREWLNENYPPQDKFIQLEQVQDKKSEL